MQTNTSDSIAKSHKLSPHNPQQRFSQQRQKDWRKLAKQTASVPAHLRALLLMYHMHNAKQLDETYRN